MTNNHKNNSDSRYFYVVVFITLSIAGIIVWQLFFTKGNYKAAVDTSLENTPKVDFAFLDSYTFQNLNKFQKGDEPLLPWDQIRNPNPFKSPEIPQERELKNWWAIFNIELELKENEWLGVYPEIIEEEKAPTLTFFEGRWYELKFSNLSDENDFKIINTSGETVVNFERDRKGEVLKFQATEGMDKYISEQQDAQGEINIVRNGLENNQSLENEQQKEVENLLREAGNDLSELDDQIEEAEETLEEDLINEAKNIYSELETEFQQLEEVVNAGETGEETVENINNFKNRINNLIKNLEDQTEDGEVI
ncbi:MAG: hypothetical protein ACQEP3_00895 [Patescibacteria group bacterium]